MHYGPDLSYIHHTGFGAFADEAAPGLLAILAAEGFDDGLQQPAGALQSTASRAVIWRLVRPTPGLLRSHLDRPWLNAVRWAHSEGGYSGDAIEATSLG